MNYTPGVSIVGVIGVVLVILKLVGIINWSWWLVLLPFYGPLAIVLIIAAIIFLWIWLYSR